LPKVCAPVGLYPNLVELRGLAVELFREFVSLYGCAGQHFQLIGQLKFQTVRNLGHLGTLSTRLAGGHRIFHKAAPA
jgi:hypothetical protein